MTGTIRWLAVMLATLGLAGCQDMPAPTAVPSDPVATRGGGAVTVATLKQVTRREMPVAVRMCEQRLGAVHCKFRVVLDEDITAPANAFQTVTKDGRPQITITAKLLGDLRNRDELAFILGHEAAHQILGHIRRSTSDATVGAVLGALVASALGATWAGLDAAQEVGATVGGRAFSKQYELEADRLGARIAEEAGYDAIRGAQYFNRVPDPGNAFLGSHPPNSQRLQAVRQAVTGS